jgi:hypothetical protein
MNNVISAVQALPYRSMITNVAINHMKCRVSNNVADTNVGIKKGVENDNFISEGD